MAVKTTCPITRDQFNQAKAVPGSWYINENADA